MNIRLLHAIALALSFCAGCATFELEGNGALTPDATTGSQTVHGSLYGYRWQPFAIEKCGADNLFRVEFHTNAAFLLVSVASLGLYVPQTVEWWCYDAAEEAKDDEEVWVPPAAAGGQGEP